MLRLLPDARSLRGASRGSGPPASRDGAVWILLACRAPAASAPSSGKSAGTRSDARCARPWPAAAPARTGRLRTLLPVAERLVPPRKRGPWTAPDGHSGVARFARDVSKGAVEGKQSASFVSQPGRRRARGYPCGTNTARSPRARSVAPSCCTHGASHDPCRARKHPAAARAARREADVEGSTWRSSLVRPLIECGDLLHPAAAIGVLEIHDLLRRPVEVIGDVRYLLVQLNEGVAEDSPGRESPAAAPGPCSASSSRLMRL